MILGIIASSISGSKVVTNSFESIATVTVGSGGSASVEFTSIPSTYTHLQIRALHRNSGSGDSAYICVAQFNSDTAANYSYHYLRGTGSAVSAGAGASQNYLLAGYEVASNTSNLGFGVFVMNILDYTSTNKNKTIRSLTGADLNGSGNVDYYSGLWFPTTPVAITSIKFYYTSNNVAQYSHFALYGIKS